MGLGQPDQTKGTALEGWNPLAPINALSLTVYMVRKESNVKKVANFKYPSTETHYLLGGIL